MRLFLAIDLPDSIRQSLLQLISTGRNLPGIRWLPSEGLHMTLKFLGEVQPETLPQIREKLAPVVSVGTSMIFSLSSGGVFPGEKKPRVFWAGVRGEIDSLGALVKQMDTVLSELGFVAEERAFHPHVTIGRSKKGISTREGMKAAQQFCTLFSPYRSEEFVVKDIHLYQSHLHSAGVRYEIIHSFPLGLS